MAFPNPKELLERVSNGNDREAFRLLVEYYSTQLYTYAMVFIKNNELAEEIVSDVWLKIWNSREQLSSIDSMMAYLYTAIKNQAYTYRTRIEKNPTLVGDYNFAFESPFIAEQRSPQSSLEERELRDFLNREIEQLPDGCREAFRLVKEEGNSYQEAAKKMNISVNTLKTHLRRAIKRLRLGLMKKLSDRISS
jgi:RNA polymerase sigma-70 factor (ECF subfamily)